eukprot:TRINITY_DN6140_c0_g1_i1.p1 TRINITY_DN6140_c0_g1~~TRINITY_DN6140_c0_g1_i1.p1  ORF type:complete len:347 (-),score=100.43 TRINITY_DN6140_c0_g1_i1:531-1484(-)
MKCERLKRFKKILKFYLINFGFKATHCKVIVDVEFILAAFEHKVHIKQNVCKVVDLPVESLHVFYTSCVLKALKEKTNSSVQMIQGLERLQCRHEPSDNYEPRACLRALFKYFLVEHQERKESLLFACQDMEFREQIRRHKKFCVIPTIYLNRQVVMIDSVSDVAKVMSIRRAHSQLKQLLTSEKKQLKADDEKKADDGQQQTKKRKRHQSMPNPLSCKKKKTQKEPASASAGFPPEKKRKVFEDSSAVPPALPDDNNCDDKVAEGEQQSESLVITNKKKTRRGKRRKTGSSSSPNNQNESLASQTPQPETLQASQQ